MDNGDSFHLTVAKNTVIYRAQVDDPLFAAHQPWQVQLLRGQMTAYTSDFPFSSIWCHLQVRWLIMERIILSLSSISFASIERTDPISALNLMGCRATCP